jgi:prepilin-type N-terminal cleavage/methylation domain-containing protein
MNEHTVATHSPEPAARRRSREGGFTLLELLIVCAVIGVIANMMIPALYSALYRAKAARIMEDYNLVRAMASQHYVDHSYFPAESGPGVEPPELVNYLNGRLVWTHPDYQYDWELWVDGSGNPTQPSTGVLVGFSIVTTDLELANALKKIFKGTLLDTIPNHTTFVIEPYTT